MAGRQMSTIMIVEDEAITALVLEREVAAGGYGVRGVAAASGEASALALRHRPQVALVDIQLATRPCCRSASRSG